MKKEGLILMFLLVGVLSLTFASAGCSDNQRIMRLYNYTNAHGAVWNDAGGNYNYEICYDQIFSTYTGSNPHDCTGNPTNPDNIILWLNKQNNSHASITHISGYDTPVCYGNLVCTARNGLSPCIGAERAVVSLYYPNNSHLANASDSNYLIKICCISPGRAYWGNMKEAEINATNKTSRVKLIDLSDGITAGNNANFTIEKLSGSSWIYFKNITVISTSGKAMTTWLTNETGKFRFRVNVYGEGIERVSGNLTVQDGTIPNPYAKITGPKDKQVYFLNEILNFTQASWDDSGYFNFTWDFGDGNITKGDSITINNYNTTHTYNSTGQKNIVLTVINEQGKTSKNKISILIVNSSFVLAYIDFPSFEQSIFGRSVNFSANSSYAINVTHYTSPERYNITCIAGNCPNQTEGCPSSFGTGCHINITNPDGTLPPNLAGFANLVFNWTILENGDSSKRYDFRGTGNSGSKFTYMFNWPATESNPHKAFLNVSWNPDKSISSTTFTEFTLSFNQPSCLKTKDFTGWVNYTSLISWQDSSYNCSKIAAIIDPNSDSTCCPAGYECYIADGKCKTGYCSDFQTSGECTAHTEFAANELNPALNKDSSWDGTPDFCGKNRSFGTNCIEKISCSCYYDSKCGSRYLSQYCNQTNVSQCWTDLSTVSANCGVSKSDTNYTECKFIFNTTDKCDSLGYIERNWVTVWTGAVKACTTDAQCQAGYYCKDGNCALKSCTNDADRKPCIAETVLGFFDWWNVVIVIIIVVLFYIIIKGRKKGSKVL